jgi:hypothetical protein
MIIDLRDYTTAPGKRDQLIERCEALLFPEQERLGATFLGAFRDADDPCRFVYVRGMPDLATRLRVLTAFYTDGEMWRRNRDEVNSWLVDSDNVLFVRPISELAPPATGPSVVGMYSHVGRQPLPEPHAAELQREVAAAIAVAGGRALVTLATDPSENNYPRHPIRTGEHGLIWLATFPRHRPLDLASITQRTLLPTAGSRLR